MRRDWDQVHSPTSLGMLPWGMGVEVEWLLAQGPRRFFLMNAGKVWMTHTQMCAGALSAGQQDTGSQAGMYQHF